MHFFGCLFALLLGILFVALAFVGTVFDFILSLFGRKPRRATRSPFSSSRQQAGPQQRGEARFSQDQRPDNDQQSHTGQQTRKIFEKDDSEYVDFEEV